MTDNLDDIPFDDGNNPGSRVDGLRLGVRPKQRKVTECVCGHGSYRHAIVAGTMGCWVPGHCPCTKFQAKPKSTRRQAIRRNAKKAETEVAKLLGGRRVPAGVASQARQGDIDVTGEWFGVQVKHRPWPTWLREAVEQAEVGVVGSGKMALVALKDKPRAQAGGNKPARILIAMDIRDFVDLHGRGNKND